MPVKPLGANGLHHIVRGRESKGVHGVLVVGGDEDHHRKPRVANLFQHLEAVEAGEANEAEQKWIRCLSQRHPLVNVFHNRRPEILEAERIRRLESQRRYPRANPIRRSRSMNLKNPTILQLIVAAGFRKQREVVDKAASVGVVLPGSSLSCMVRGELGHPSARASLAKVLGLTEAKILEAIGNSATESIALSRAQSKAKK